MKKKELVKKMLLGVAALTLSGLAGYAWPLVLPENGFVPNFVTGVWIGIVSWRKIRFEECSFLSQKKV